MSQTATQTLSQSEQFDEIEAKLARCERLDFDDGLVLYHSNDLFRLGKLAEQQTLAHQGRNVYYSLNRHINYTNVCKFNCKFCGFKSWHGEDNAYTHDVQAVVDFARQAYDDGATEVHIVGGIHPGLDFSYYIQMLTEIRRACPDMHIKAFTAVEILDLVKKSKLSIEDTLLELQGAGLDALPGGGAEILDDDYFNQVCRSKSKPEIWTDIHRTAHRIGLVTNCTMLYGFIETLEQRVNHLLRLREIQNASLAEGKGRFQCFIPLPYLKPEKMYRDSPEYQNSSHQIDALEDLKTIAISRLLLDNVDNHKAFWPMQGVNLSQVALTFGANDLDGTVRRYTIVDKTYDNETESLPVEKIRAAIIEAGRTPVQRDGLYQPIT
jgi:aminodeoxyfutalosine synthase